MEQIIKLNNFTDRSNFGSQKSDGLCSNLRDDFNIFFFTRALSGWYFEHQLGIVMSDRTQTNEKKNLNNDTVEQKRGSCTQILKTYAGVLDRDAEAQTASSPRGKKLDKTYSQTVF